MCINKGRNRLESGAEAGFAAPTDSALQGFRCAVQMYFSAARDRKTQCASFSPMMPPITASRLTMRSTETGSPKKHMPAITVPAAPIPVQIA